MVRHRQKTVVPTVARRPRRPADDGPRERSGPAGADGGACCHRRAHRWPGQRGWRPGPGVQWLVRALRGAADADLAGGRRRGRAGSADRRPPCTAAGQRVPRPTTGGTTMLKYPKQLLAVAGVIVTAGTVALTGLTAASASPAAARAAHPAARTARPAVRAAISGAEHFQLMTTSVTSDKATVI